MKKCPNPECDEELTVVESGIVCTSCGFSALIDFSQFTHQEGSENTAMLGAVLERLKWIMYASLGQVGLLAVLLWLLME